MTPKGIDQSRPVTEGQYMERHFADTAKAFVSCPCLKKVKCAQAHYVHGIVAHPVDGIFIVQLNCPATWMLLPLKS